MAHRATGNGARTGAANNTLYSPVGATDSRMEQTELKEMNTPTPAAPPAPAAPPGGDKRIQILGAMAACCFAVCMGTTMGWTSAANKLVNAKSGLSVTTTEYSWIGACMPLGAMLAALPASRATNRWGRKKLLLVLSPALFLSWLLIIFAQAAWMIILSRLLIGAAIGSISLIAPMYSNEIAHKSIRGTLGGFFQFLHTCGVLLAYVLGAVISDLMWISVICALVPLVAGFLFFFFEDTPTWHLQQGREQEARQSLRFFRGKDYPSEVLEEELDAIKKEISDANQSQLSVTEAFSTRAAKMGLMLSMNLMVVQQLSGVSAVIFYASNIFEAAGSKLNADASSIIMGACLAGATLVSLFLVDRLGRRVLLLVSGIACVICNVVLGVYLYLLDKQGKAAMEPYGMIPIITMGLFMVLFSIGYGPIPWTYMAEVFTIDIRGTAMSIATITNWAMVFIVTLFYEPLSTAVGNYTTFWIFAAVVLAGSVIVALFLVETNNVDSEDIQAQLRGERRRGQTTAAA